MHLHSKNCGACKSSNSSRVQTKIFWELFYFCLVAPSHATILQQQYSRNRTAWPSLVGCKSASVTVLTVCTVSNIKHICLNVMHTVDLHVPNKIYLEAIPPTHSPIRWSLVLETSISTPGTWCNFYTVLAFIHCSTCSSLTFTQYFCTQTHRKDHNISKHVSPSC